MSILKTQLFTATPNPLVSHSLQKNYRKRLKNSFLKLLGIAESGYQQITPRYDLCATRRTIATLDINKKFHPSFYYIHFELLQALKNHNIQKVHSLMEAIKQQKEPYLKNIFIENIYTDWWEADMLLQIQAPVAQTHWPRHKIKFNQLDTIEFQKNYDIVNNVLWLLREADPLFFKEICGTVSKIKLHQGEAVMGMTSPKFHGAMFIAIPAPHEDPELFFCKQITREASHMLLNALLTQDKLIINPLTEQYPDPLQNNLKPMLNIFHSTFVLSRIWHVLHKLKPFFGRNDYLTKAMEKALAGFERGYHCIRTHATLTPAGKIFTDSLGELVRGN